MLHIVGGFYEELCLYPHWHQNFGSGGRAAAALSAFGEKICFHTYVHDKQKYPLEHFSELFGLYLLPHARIRPQRLSV